MQVEWSPISARFSKVLGIASPDCLLPHRRCWVDIVSKMCQTFTCSKWSLHLWVVLLVECTVKLCVSSFLGTQLKFVLINFYLFTIEHALVGKISLRLVSKCSLKYGLM